MSESKMRRIRALLAQAEDPAATPEEAEAFSAKAEELMIRYSIDHAMIEAQKPGTREVPVLRSFPLEETYAKPKMFLLAGIAQAFPTSVVKSGRALQVIGFPSDLNLIDTLYTSLLLQANSAMVRQYRSDRSFRTSFMYGFATRAAARAKDTYSRVTEEVSREQTGTALVLVERKSEVDAEHARHYGARRMGKVSRAKVGSGSGYQRGTEAADRADMGGTRFSGSRRALA